MQKWVVQSEGGVMFPWSDSCQVQRLRRRRRLSDEEDLLDEWRQG